MKRVLALAVAALVLGVSQSTLAEGGDRPDFDPSKAPVPAYGASPYTPSPEDAQYDRDEGRAIPGKNAPVPAHGATGYTSPCAANEVETAAYDRHFNFIGYICVRSNDARN